MLASRSVASVTRPWLTSRGPWRQCREQLHQRRGPLPGVAVRSFDHVVLQVGGAARRISDPIVGLAARRVAPVSRTEVKGSRMSAHVSRSGNHVPRMLVHAAETLARGSRQSLVDCGTFFTCRGALLTARGPSLRAADHCAPLAGCSSCAEDHCAPLAGRVHVPRTIGHRSRVVLHVSRAIFQPNAMGRVRSEPALSVAGADSDVA